MILQLQAKVHGMGNLGVSTCTYPIFSKFKTTFCPPSFLPPFLHDDWLVGWLLFSSLVGWSVGWLAGSLFGLLVG